MTQRVFQPFGHLVLVRLKKVEQEKEVKSESGIILKIKKNEQLENEQAAHVDAYIVAIGKTANKYLDNHDGQGVPEYKVGDLVMIGKYAGRLVPDIFDEEEIYRLIKDIDVLGLYKGEGIDNLPEVALLAE